MGGFKPVSTPQNLLNPKNDILYNIGQKTLSQGKHEIYDSIKDSVERGAAIVNAEGWVNAVKPEGAGWGLGIGKALQTGPTASAAAVGKAGIAAGIASQGPPK